MACDGKREAGELGFEPRLSGPEPLVLPLHHSPSLGAVLRVPCPVSVGTPDGVSSGLFCRLYQAACIKPPV